MGEHVDYPHAPGYLYDCLACESECHCQEGLTEMDGWTRCIYCTAQEPYVGNESD